MAFFHWRVYARAAFRDRRWEEAADAASRGLALGAPIDFERQNLHMVLAVAAANLGRVDEALEHLREATTPKPEPPDADRWPLRPSVRPDYFLNWARENVAEYFGPVADAPRFRRIVFGNSTTPAP
jgi:tetratricopeptide (TPR) repeat protein